MSIYAETVVIQRGWTDGLKDRQTDSFSADCVSNCTQHVDFLPSIVDSFVARTAIWRFGLITN